MRKSYKIRLRILGAALCLALIFLNNTSAIQALRTLPSRVYLKGDSKLSLSLPYPLSISEDSMLAGASGDESIQDVSGVRNVKVKLFGVIPVKDIAVYSGNSRYLIPSGRNIGIALHSYGVLVVATSEVVTEKGSFKSPAASSGIKAGDLIVSVNGQETPTSNILADICRNGTGTFDVEYVRDGKTEKVQIKGLWDEYEQGYKLGAWVRDSTSGVGTLSFYDPESMEFAALGHAVTDIDTESVFTISNGRITDCSIVDIERGKPGTPGKLVGTFSNFNSDLGTIDENGELGIYGKLNDTVRIDGTPVPLAYPDDVHTGRATLYTTLKDGVTREYECEIIKTYSQSEAQPKGLVIEVRDERLLNETGGIVQGMSGSPVIQDGKLAAVVTHVMINNPERGYCVYAFWMAEKVAD